jgi:lysyl-tRNA synthetase class 2
MVTSVTGSSKVNVPKKHSSELVEIDFQPPFKRISIMDELEKHLGEKLPNLEDPGNKT